jgi:hypothetical protein
MSLSAPDEEAQSPFLQRPSNSEATRELIDGEIRSIVQASYREAERLLAAHRPQLDALAAALLASESLDQREILDVTGLAAQQPVETRSALPGRSARPSVPGPPSPDPPGACAHARSLGPGRIEPTLRRRSQDEWPVGGRHGSDEQSWRRRDPATRVESRDEHK